MQETVPVTNFPLPGLRNGLGLFRLPLSSGGYYWRHGGSMIGYLTMDGATPDGRRSVAVLTTSRAHTDFDFETRQNAAINELIDNALSQSAAAAREELPSDYRLQDPGLATSSRSGSPSSEPRSTCALPGRARRSLPSTCRRSACD
jgi:hypothetical protein